PHWAAGGAPAQRGGPPQRPLPLSRPPSEYLKRIWVDTASPSPAALAANLAVFGTSRMLLGTDSPPLAGIESPVLAAIDALPIDDDERKAVLGGNAQQLFRL
ncbi:MAG: hypothetical protein QOG94_3865, partial [Solirubrobacteraceae bacterium]|nr:hypothetical protein [Solirubrobacteraceae bacterium]